jgi:hypothetical protein
MWMGAGENQGREQNESKRVSRWCRLGEKRTRGRGDEREKENGGT